MSIEQDATVHPTDQQLSQLAALAQRQIVTENLIAEAEAKVTELKETLRRIATEDIPGVMAEIGMSSFELSTGERIEVKRAIRASIPVRLRDEAFAWLRANGHDSLIKNEIVARFGKGEGEFADELVRYCRERQYLAERKESVHPQTLSAFVREQLEVGANIPMDALGVFVQDQAKITRRDR